MPIPEVTGGDSGDSLLHEALLADSLRQGTQPNRSGTFSSPIPLVRHMVSAALTLNPAPTVLDPACGSGIFLLETAQQLAKIHGAETAEARTALVCAHLFGVDRDPRAVAKAQELLERWCIEQTPEIPRPDLSSRFYAADFLLDSVIDSLPPFDLVIGNPPYGISRDEQLSPIENEALRARYQGVTSGRVNKYLVFLQRAFELLSPSGTVRLVVPNAWLGIREASLFRRTMITAGALAELEVFQKALFPGLGVEAVIVTLHKTPVAHLIIRSSPALGAPLCTVRQVDHQTLLSNPGAEISLTWSDEIADIWSTLHASGRTLGQANSPGRPRVALQIYRTGGGDPAQTPEVVATHPFHTPQSGPDTVPYLTGKDIKRYGITWSGEFVRYGPWVAEYRPVEEFSGPRIVLREVLGTHPNLLSATLLDKPFLYNRSALHILLRNGATKVDLLVLLGILNSPVGSFVIATKGKKSQRRLFPKIVKQDLHDFPLPTQANWQGHRESLGQLVEERLGSAQPKELEARINERVQQIYELSSEQWAAITATRTWV